MTGAIALFCLLPMVAALGSAFVIWKLKEKDLLQNLFVTLLIFGAVGFLLESVPTDSMLRALAKCLSMLVVPIIFPMTIMFLDSLYYQTRLSWLVGFLFLPAVVFSSVATTLNLLLYPHIVDYQTLMTVTDASALRLFRMHLVVCNYIYPVILLAYGAGILWRGTTILKNTGFSWDAVEGFLFKGDQIPILHVFCVILLTFYPVLLFHLSLRAVLSNGFFVFLVLIETGLIVLISLAGRRMSQPGGFVLTDMKWNAKPRVTLAEQYSYIDDNTEIDEELLTRFQLIQSLEVMMQKDKIFLNPEVSIEGVAADLNTNRLYLSRLVNAEFGMNFRAFINDYRVEYSQQYMQENPDANQESVAFVCGFPSASTFNRKFKDVVGMTPKAWCLMKGITTSSNEAE